MTRKRFEAWVRELDATNAEYILADREIKQKYENYLHWKNKDDAAVRAAREYHENDTDAEINAKCLRISKSVLGELEEMIRQYDEHHLTPANAKVGDGATVYLYSDSHAGTIVKVTKCTVTVRRDKATLNPNFKPEFVPGGFAAHCTNQHEQSYTYEPDENGTLTTVYWSKKHNCYGLPGNLQLSKGRHEFYDYNF